MTRPLSQAFSLRRVSTSRSSKLQRVSSSSVVGEKKKASETRRRGGRRMEGREEMAITHWRSSQVPARALSSFGGSGQRRRCYGGACYRARTRARKIVPRPGVSDARSDKWTDETGPRERSGERGVTGKEAPPAHFRTSIPPSPCLRQADKRLTRPHARVTRQTPPASQQWDRQARTRSRRTTTVAPCA